MILESISVGEMEVNCYVLAAQDNSSGIIIDPGGDEAKIRRVLNKHRLQPAFIINTHGHFDHIAADDKFRVPVYIHEQDAVFLKDPKINLFGLFGVPFQLKSEIKLLHDKDIVGIEGIQLEVIHTPGHTPGGICLLLKQAPQKILFSGDTLFCQGIGRTDFPGADERQLIESIKKKLFFLDNDTLVYPGHGPASSIGREKESNPFLSQ